jgi:hypothetical protein
MTVKIDSTEPNNFPAVEDLDVQDAGRDVTLTLATKIGGQLVPVIVHLSYQQANDLAVQLEIFRKV